MIEIDLITAIAILIFFIILLAVGSRFIYTYNREEKDAQKEQLPVQCPYCAHFFFPQTKKDILSCPRCKSYVSFKEQSPENANEKTDSTQ